MLIVLSLQEKLKEALTGPIEALLDGANSDTWPTIKNLLKRETESAKSGFSTSLSGFDMDEITRQKMITNLEDIARGVVEAKAREEAGRVLIRMKDRSEASATCIYSDMVFFPYKFQMSLTLNLKKI